MVLTDADLGRNLKNAREMRGVTQDGLASRTGKSRSAISKMESGSQKISTMDLAHFAEALGMRLTWLLEEPPASIVSHRVTEERTVSRIDLVLEEVAREVEFVASISRRFAKQLSRLPQPLPRPETPAEVTEAAVHARGLLGVPASGPLQDLARRMEEAGVFVFSVQFDVDEADGGTVLLEAGAVSVVNASMRVGRRRLTAAHELGHALFADSYSVDYPIGEDAERSEVLMDAFARALLLPAGSVRERWEELRDGSVRNAAIRLGSEYRVDMATLARRLHELNLVDSEDEHEVRRARTMREDFEYFGLVNSDELRKGWIPQTYRDAVENLYIADEISEDRAIELLRGTVTVGDLPELPEMAEQDLWSLV